MVDLLLSYWTTPARAYCIWSIGIASARGQTIKEV